MSASLLMTEAARIFFHEMKMWDPDHYEMLLAQRYRSFLDPGDTVIDIGAHSGRHTVQLAEAVGPSGKVFAFEPLPEMFPVLEHHCEPYPWIKTEQTAIGAEGTDIEFVRATDALGESGFMERTRYNSPAAKPEKIKVRSRTLDSLAADVTNVRYIKIDTEGAEMLILRSGASLLGRDRPIVSVEFGTDSFSAYGLQPEDLYYFRES